MPIGHVQHPTQIIELAKHGRPFLLRRGHDVTRFESFRRHEQPTRWPHRSTNWLSHETHYLISIVMFRSSLVLILYPDSSTCSLRIRSLYVEQPPLMPT